MPRRDLISRANLSKYVWSLDIPKLFYRTIWAFAVKQARSLPDVFVVPVALWKWSFSQMEYFHSVYIPLERVFPTSDWTSTVNHRNVWLSETRCHHVTKKVNYPYHSNANTSAPHFRGAWSPLFDDLLVQRTSELKISMLRASEKQNLENDDKPQRDIKVATRTKLSVSSRRALCWLIDFIIPVFTLYPAEAQTKAMAP